MKKVLLLMWSLLLGIATINAQTLVYKKPINANSTSDGNARAPQTSHRNTKVVYLITAAEMAAVGMGNGVDLKSIGFYYTKQRANPTATPPVLAAVRTTAVASGTLKVYLQNTTHTAYGKGTSFSAALTGMTKVSDGTETIDATADSESIPNDIEFKNGDPFTYTGGGLYVAFEWSNTGTVGGANIAVCNGSTAATGNANGLYQSSSTSSATGANNTIASSAFRPNTHFSYEVPASDLGVSNVYAMSTAPVNEGLQKITARVLNNGAAVQNNVEATLTVTGANTFTDTKTIATINSEGEAIVQFDDFIPANKGTNTITVTLNVTDGNANNNSLAVTQIVGDGRFSHNIDGTDNTSTSSGSNVGKAVLAARYYANSTVYPKGIRFKVSQNTTSADKERPVKAVLINRNGNVIAESAPYNIEAIDYGTWLTLTFTATDQGITDDYFFVGVALLGNTDGAAYYPMTTQLEGTTRPATYYFLNEYDGGPTVAFGGYSTSKYSIEAFTTNAVLNEDDASTSTIYALNKNPLTYGAPETIQAIVTNNGETPMVNVPVALNVTGGNTFANNKVIAKLPAGASATVTFDGFTATAKGTNTITVTPNGNVTKALSVSQEITDGVFSHVVGNTISTNYGSNTGNLIFLAKYHMTGSRKIKAVRQTVGNSSGNTGKIIFAVLTDAAGNILARSNNYTILDGDRGQVKDFLLQTPTTITNADFMVGIAMDLSNTGFFPAATQIETPLRAGLYFTRTTADAGFTLGAGAGRYMASAVTEDEVLPVTISTFTAKLNNNKVALNWTVGTETNVNRYEVERSTNGVDFIKVAEVVANGSSSYATVDAKPELGINYYRLKGVDNDGTLSPFNEVRSIKVNSLEAKVVSVYPNPLVGNTINVTLSNYTKGTYTYKLVDASGRLIQQGSFENNGSESSVITVANTLTKGIYVLHIINGSETIQSKLIKQ
ncbi:MAG: T9SS type A sorting domain-containing protein [Pedobacter sp.]|uniref:T9SS type A sorting domain-containing protein n=1 Tax=Pedobacter sp. TaxID=1411316 RepID=UPI00280A0C24|nr:T9SS type A sorting domain-containing protein [Pedobacter sp.]MDQ8004632.1 T9SS type A sorting domain-containing protein [Pedobacter sp.]